MVRPFTLLFLLRRSELTSVSTVVPEAKYANEKGLEQNIVEFVQSKVAPHKRLRGGVVLIEVIPKSCVSLSLSPLLIFFSLLTRR
jgi:hypothetical protein